MGKHVPSTMFLLQMAVVKVPSRSTAPSAASLLAVNVLRSQPRPAEIPVEGVGGEGGGRTDMKEMPLFSGFESVYLHT